jgi:hypothetical protein
MNEINKIYNYYARIISKIFGVIPEDSRGQGFKDSSGKF